MGAYTREGMSCKSSVLQDSYGQLTGASRVNILASALTYSNANANPNPYALKRPLSNTAYIAYKKAQILAASKPGIRPQQTVIITELQALGCL
jgi:hypothetical protein